MKTIFLFFVIMCSLPNVTFATDGNYSQNLVAENLSATSGNIYSVNKELNEKLQKQHLFILGILALLSLNITYVVIATLKINKLKNGSQNIKQRTEKVKDRMEAVLQSNKKLLGDYKDRLNAREKALLHKEIQITSYHENIKKMEAKISEIIQSGKEIRPGDLIGLERQLGILAEEESLWDDFRIQFENTHPGFIEKLEAVYPELSINDLKHCAFVMAKLRIKEVASILNISPRSVETHRYRVKKKLGIPKNERLSDFLKVIAREQQTTIRHMRPQASEPTRSFTTLQSLASA